MRFNWVLSHNFYTCNDQDWQRIQNCAPTWSALDDQRPLSVQNCVASDASVCLTAIKSEYYRTANLYVPYDFWSAHGRPSVVQVFQTTHYPKIQHLDDIVALHLAAANSDIVLLLGFDFELRVGPVDTRTAKHLQEYHGLLRSCLVNNPLTQFVAVDHGPDFDTAYKNIANLTCDTLQAVLTLLEVQ